MSDGHTTRTDLHRSTDPEGDALVPVLTIANHPEPKLIGRRRVLADGDVLELGRGTTELSRGALDHDLVSRRHAVVERRGEAVVIRDLGSHNGTSVNGDEIDSRQLESHDVVGLGPIMLLFGFGPVLAPRNDTELLIGVSAPMGRIAGRIQQVAPADTTVLIQGETGVGKELVAAEVHRQSGRSGQFVAVNCATLSDPLVHSELFGHTKGAFSGAQGERAGLVAAAAGGTLFLDEIGDASEALQASLLRLLEQREYRQVGSDRLLTSDARFVAATHRPLWQAADEGAFRHDVLARLAMDEIGVPPLRQRPVDVIPLALHLAQQSRGTPASLSRSLALALLRHPWPYNVRELKTVIELALRERPDGGELELTDTVRDRLRAREPVPATDEPQAPMARFLPPPKPTPEQLRAGLAAHGFSVQAFAKDLAVSRNTVYRWLDDAGLDIRALRRGQQR